MGAFIRAARLDITESLRARWFGFYSLVFGGIIVLLFVFGLTESRILGFTGLSRLLVTYIQLCVAILPIFVLITTVRSVAGDREAGVFEYMLSLPVGLAAWYWGKMVGRFTVVFLPVFLAMAGAAAWSEYSEIGVPWGLFTVYTGLLVSLAWSFLGFGMLISAAARSSDVAQTGAFLLWLVLLLFLDLILLGVMVREHLPLEAVVAIALANPLQSFRTAAILLFDPQMVVLGPAAYVILDDLGQGGYLAFALVWPLLLGTGAAYWGYRLFRRGDLP
ncbi:ABC transporter permease [Magnetospirillum gryphiswaldense]|uniref:Membrane protein nosY n=2 Tax=Magnetospirillum gryphiswaldense TaxID=55518 RepID=V6F2V5_MAGGM|nr:ABC transporter permease subunit [Magnetospirillum gryphiswaldense]AVM73324.1 ABC-2 family transporter protein [Magnetospirillum gryphiswaldense MSR-1]AVM77227.1 ABC-2 family transporter protein [Magnetospirillum gryphiswaldense]CAM74912.1 membrane protein [Magnetospirillum gryphiswaldense MSR-1]CDK98636.1 putative Membrane protein nosY [Magnetospirillum gryphiswaldense MSR-1 v2]